MRIACGYSVLLLSMPLSINYFGRRVNLYIIYIAQVGQVPVVLYHGDRERLDLAGEGTLPAKGLPSHVNRAETIT